MTQTPWLDADERAAWLPLIGTLLRLGPALDTQMQRDSGMTHFDYQVLAMLSEAPERRLEMSALARQVNASLSRLSHVVSKLEARGLVHREPSPASRRIRVCVLSDEGYAVLEAAAPGHVATVRQLVFDGLSREQVHQLAAIAETMRHNIETSGLRSLDG